MRPLIPALIGDSSTSIYKYKHSICKHNFEHKLLMLTDDAYGQPCVASEDQAQIILGYEINLIERDSKKNN